MAVWVSYSLMQCFSEVDAVVEQSQNLRLCSLFPLMWCGEEAAPASLVGGAAAILVWWKSLPILKFLVFYMFQSSCPVLIVHFCRNSCVTFVNVKPLQSMSVCPICLPAQMSCDIKVVDQIMNVILIFLLGYVPLTLKVQRCPFYSIYLAYLHFKPSDRADSCMQGQCQVEGWQKEHSKVF